MMHVYTVSEDCSPGSDASYQIDRSWSLEHHGPRIKRDSGIDAAPLSGPFVKQQPVKEETVATISSKAVFSTIAVAGHDAWVTEGKTELRLLSLDMKLGLLKGKRNLDSSAVLAAVAYIPSLVPSFSVSWRIARLDRRACNHAFQCRYICHRMNSNTTVDLLLQLFKG